MKISGVVSIVAGSVVAATGTLALLTQTPVIGPKRLGQDQQVVATGEHASYMPLVSETRFERTGGLIHPASVAIGLGGGYIEVEKREPEVYILVEENGKQKTLRVVNSYIVIPPLSSTSDGVGVGYETFDGTMRRWLYNPDETFKEDDDTMPPSNRIARYFHPSFLSSIAGYSPLKK